jgi:hypothetical protein
MIEEIRRERLVEVAEDMDSLKLFSTEQRNKIARTEADFVSCMKQFEKFHLNPEKYMNAKELFDHFLELFNKSEIHKIPSEIIYHSKFGVALSQIYEILRSNFEHIPLKHTMMLTLLDDTIKLLDKKVEDIVSASDSSTLRATI